jgi:hypothetical protein
MTFIAGVLLSQTDVVVTFAPFSKRDQLPQNWREIADINFSGKNVKGNEGTLVVYTTVDEQDIHAWKEDDGTGQPGWVPLGAIFVPNDRFKGQGWDGFLIANIPLDDPPIAVG